jgi:hypothetical protein
MLDVTYGESARLWWICFGLCTVVEDLRCGLKASIAISIGVFSMFWIVRRRTMLHPNEEQ